MNLVQYGFKRRALFGGITTAVNNRLRTWSPPKRACVTFTDGERDQLYTLLIHSQSSWTLFVHDGINWVLLEVAWRNGRMQRAGGIHYGPGMGRVIYVDTVPNQHALES